MITIRRNKPLLYRDLALKDLVLDAYEHGRLIAIVPFACHVRTVIIAVLKAFLKLRFYNISMCVCVCVFSPVCTHALSSH